MNLNCFTRPNKPMLCKRPNFDIVAPVININAPKLLTVDAGTECHTTPDDVAARMAEYLEYQAPTLHTAGSTLLEPQAGTGQLVQALVDSGVEVWRINTIEKHSGLVDHLNNRFEGLNVNHGDFLTDYKEFTEEYDRVISNPPFSKVIAHVQQAVNCLKPNGIGIFLVPMSYKKIDHEVLEELHSDTFLNCKVFTKIIKITR
ncbi:MAG: hypothetical protein MJK15_00760 [Colwellia sp.]|nr:hypothetical protein [Colwellia sp.]